MVSIKTIKIGEIIASIIFASIWGLLLLSIIRLL